MINVMMTVKIMIIMVDHIKVSTESEYHSLLKEIKITYIL